MSSSGRVLDIQRLLYSLHLLENSFIQKGQLAWTGQAENFDGEAKDTISAASAVHRVFWRARRRILQASASQQD